MSERQKFLLRRAMAFFGVVAVAVTMLFVPSMAKADTYNYPGCDWGYDTTWFAYDAGSYDVFAGKWHEYGNENSVPSCHDINVEIASTGGMTVRTQVCPYTGSCYVVQPNNGWGALTNLGPTYGVTLHSYHMPCFCAFRFRIETACTNCNRANFGETVRVIF